MTTRGGRGGYQKPARPAASSGPGSLSQRTDGGPADKQPIRTATGQGYGEAKALTEQQQGAPMAAGAPGGAGGASPAPTGPEGVGAGIFGPTQRPGEPPTAGGQPLEDPVMANTDEAIRMLYSKFPHPNIERMLNKRADYR